MSAWPERGEAIKRQLDLGGACSCCCLLGKEVLLKVDELQAKLSHSHYLYAEAEVQLLRMASQIKGLRSKLNTARVALEKYSRPFIEDGELQIGARWINDNELSGQSDDGECAKAALILMGES